MLTVMRHRGRLVLVTLFVLCWSLLGLAFPLFKVMDTSGTGSLQAAPKDVFTVGEPISLGFGLTLARSTVSVSDKYSDGGSLESVLTSGKANLVIDGGILRFDARGTAPSLEEFQAPMLAALTNGQFETLKLRRVQFVVVLNDERTETLSDVSVDVSNRRRNGLSLVGTAVVRGLSHAIDIQIGAPADRRMPMRLGLRASIKGGLLTGTFDGRLAVGEPLNLQGVADLTLADLRVAARAFGLDVASGDPLGSFKGKGRLDWTRTMIAFDRATFQHDSGEATGTLALDLEQVRPVLSGTLAFRALDLTRLASALQGAEARTWTDFGRARPFLPVAQDLDVDVRLSAGTVKFGALDLGPTAATINLKNSKLNAELAEFEFAGSKGSAQASADLARAAPRLTWRAKVTGLDAAKATAFVWGTPVLTGQATLQADLSAEGPDTATLGETTRGTVVLRMSEGARVGLDLRALFSIAPGVPANGGWEAWTRTSTALDALDARLSLRDGMVIVDSAVGTVGDARYELSGRLDRIAKRLEARLRQIREAKPGQPTIDALKIDGDVARPSITREAVPSRAAAPAQPVRPPG